MKLKITYTFPRSDMFPQRKLTYEFLEEAA